MTSLSRSLRRHAYVSISATTGVTLWYTSPTFREILGDSATPIFGKTIEVPWPLRGPDGKVVSTTKKFPRLRDEVVDTRIREYALGQTTRQPGGTTWRYQTASLAANDGIEDAHAQALVERDLTPLAPAGDLLLFAVMDGHGGPHTSRLLSKALIPAVTAEMSALINSTQTIPPKSISTLSYIKSFFVSPSPGEEYEFDVDPSYVSPALRSAFSALDSRIIDAPINLLSHIEAQNDDSTKPHEHPLANSTLEPAISGSCALLAMLDTSRRDMYVACTGDSRAVAGYWDQPKDGSPGSWRAEVLTEDQTGRNPNELKRMRSEHPAEEAPYVIQRGLDQNFLPQGLPQGSIVCRTATDLKTPPYVVADPVVTHRKLSFLPDPSTSRLLSSTTTSSNPEVKSTLKFVVLATDGLWDELSSKDVIALVGGHFSGVRGTAVPKSTIPVHETAEAAGIEGKPSLARLADKNSSESIPEGKWAFVDEHVGTHLIRNALGGADREKLAWQVSLPLGVAREFRDDITVTVVWYEDFVTHASEPIKANL